MIKFRILFFALMGALGLVAGLVTTPAFAADRDTTVTKVAKVDVNNATEEELEALPGIGKGNAKKIIDGRPYHTEEDLINAGISRSTVDKIKDSIRFGRVKEARSHTKTDAVEKDQVFSKSSKVDVNNATEEELEVLPGIGKGNAKKIIDGRPYHTEEDLINAGISKSTVDKIKDSIRFGRVKEARSHTKSDAVEKDQVFSKSGKVDVNNATEEELEELPGIGKGNAKKIIDGRPYRTEADLINAGISKSTVDKIRDSIRFGRVRSSTTTESKASSSTKAESREHSSTYDSDRPAKVPPRKGMVWVNKNTMVYHTEGDRWYGKTENGEFMTEQDAIKSGAHLSKQDEKKD